MGTWDQAQLRPGILPDKAESERQDGAEDPLGSSRFNKANFLTGDTTRQSWLKLHVNTELTGNEDMKLYRTKPLITMENKIKSSYSEVDSLFQLVGDVFASVHRPAGEWSFTYSMQFDLRNTRKHLYILIYQQKASVSYDQKNLTNNF